MKIQINKCYLVSTPVQGTDASAQRASERIALEAALAEKAKLIRDIYNDETCRELEPSLFQRLHKMMSR